VDAPELVHQALFKCTLVRVVVLYVHERFDLLHLVDILACLLLAYVVLVLLCLFVVFIVCLIQHVVNVLYHCLILDFDMALERV